MDVTWVEPTFSDNVQVKTVDKSHSSGSTFELGSTYVTYTAVDYAGNSAECKFVVQLLRKLTHPRYFNRFRCAYVTINKQGMISNDMSKRLKV